MAQSLETGNPTVTAVNPIAELLAAPLSPDWTIEGLAEQLLGTLAAQPEADGQEYVLDAESINDRQSQRLLRPLLACLATKSAAEAGAAPSIYGGSLGFKRSGSRGPVWIVGQFENKPGAVRLALQRAYSQPQYSAMKVGTTRAAAETAARA